MNFDADNLKRQLPHYLTPRDHQIILEDSEKISRGNVVNYFLNPNRNNFETEMLRGDGWKGLQIFKFNTGKWDFVKGIVLSNSCDIDPQNSRDIRTRVIFAPLAKLSGYEKILNEKNIDRKATKQKIQSIRSQKAADPKYENKFLSMNDGGYQVGECYATISFGTPISFDQLYGEYRYKFVATIIEEPK